MAKADLSSLVCGLREGLGDGMGLEDGVGDLLHNISGASDDSVEDPPFCPLSSLTEESDSETDTGHAAPPVTKGKGNPMKLGRKAAKVC